MRHETIKSYRPSIPSCVEESRRRNALASLRIYIYMYMYNRVRRGYILYFSGVVTIGQRRNDGAAEKKIYTYVYNCPYYTEEEITTLTCSIGAYVTPIVISIIIMENRKRNWKDDNYIANVCITVIN